MHNEWEPACFDTASTTRYLDLLKYTFREVYANFQTKNEDYIDFVRGKN